nr:HNH endonuclease [uncultured Allomuricauda sp.]
MAEITNEHIVQAYKIAVKVFDKSISLKEGLDILVNEGMKRSSASDYVYNYGCMRKGKLMTRNANAFSTEYYLSKIYENHGDNGLQKALISLSLHLDYYEQVSGARVVQRRKIYDKYLKILNHDSKIIYPDDVEANEKFLEGKSKKVSVNIFERNSIARAKCIEHFGCKCQVCEFDFSNRYGKIGAGFIHVHHLVDISTIGKEYELDPITDLIPVCPNCHAMLHKKKPSITIEELKNITKNPLD